MAWRKAVGKSLRGLFSFLILFVVLFLAFDKLAQFSDRQSVALALVVAWLSFGVRETSVKQTTRFVPYYVSVRPHWNVIFDDLGVACGDEEWKAIWAHIGESPADKYALMRDGITFTILQHAHYAAQLVFLNNRPSSSFIGEVDLEEEVGPISFLYQTKSIALELTNPDNRRRGMNRVLRFQAKRGIDGYNLSLDVPDWWWNQFQGPLKTAVKTDKDYGTGSVYVTLATIPYTEFSLYWEPEEYNAAEVKQASKQMDKARATFGWKLENPPDTPELGIVWPEVIEHKYFKVSHRHI